MTIGKSQTAILISCFLIFAVSMPQSSFGDSSNRTVGVFLGGTSENDSVVMWSDKRWTSSSSGFLTGDGQWKQKAGGVEIYDGDGKYVIRIAGLNFNEAKKGQTGGKFFSGEGTQGGSWKIIDVTDAS